MLEVLRESLESGKISISRAGRQVTFPASFQLIAAMNPCPCGYYGDTQNNCRCSAAQIERYQSKLSGPLLDRIDIHIEVPAISHRELQDRTEATETSAQVKQRVVQAHQWQKQRRGKCNAHLNNREIEQDSLLQAEDQKVLQKSMEKMKLSARAYHRILKLARTIADLDNSDQI